MEAWDVNPEFGALGILAAVLYWLLWIHIPRLMRKRDDEADDNESDDG